MVTVPDLGLSNLVEVYCGDGYAYLAGLKGRTVWFARPADRQLAEVLKLDRLDLQGGYDPGGLHYIEYRELPSGDLLLSYEFGLARLTPDGTVRWHKVHDQLPARFEYIADGVVWLSGEYGRLGFRLDDGRSVEV
jgi:hypothetical protein